MKNLSKKITLFMIATVVTFLGITYTLFKGTQATEVTELPANSAFDDINFYKCVVDTYNDKNDTDYDYTTYSLSDEELASISVVSCSYYDKTDEEKISSSLGVEKMTSLLELNLSYNKLTEIDVSQNILLKKLDLYDNELEEIDLSKNTNLIELDLSHNNFVSIDISKCTNLENLIIFYNNLETLDVSQNISLIELNANNNELTEINLSQNVSLEKLNLNCNSLEEIDVSKNVSLVELEIDKNNFESVDVSKNILLKKLGLGYNKLTEINLSENSSLKQLYMPSNQLTKINLSKNIALTSINLSYNDITELDVTNNPLVTYLGVFYNQLTKIDLSKNTSLKNLYIHKNQLVELDLSNILSLEKLDVSENQLTEIDLSENTKLIELDLSNNKLTSLDLSENTSLKSIITTNNLFETDLFLYKNKSTKLKPLIIFPENLGLTNSVWTVENTNMAIVNEDEIVTALNVGSTSAVGKTENYYIGTNVLNIVEITSDKYEINEEDEWIYVGTESDKEIITDNFSLSDERINLNVDLIGNKLQVKHVDEALKEFELLMINFGDYEILNNSIMLIGGTSYERFVNHITKSDEITYKIYNADDVEITAGNMNEATNLKVYYGNIVIDEYTISKTNEYLEFDNSLKLDDTNMIVGSIDINTTINNLKSKLNTTGEVSVFDKDNNVIEDADSKLKTGNKIKIKLSSQEFVYTISVTGDVTGDGDITADDIQKISKHLLNGDEIVGEEYLLASDYDKDDTIDINDIVKLSKYIDNSELWGVI